MGPQFAVDMTMDVDFFLGTGICDMSQPRGAIGAYPPQAVRAEAERLGLGGLVAGRRGSNPFVRAGLSLLMALLCFGVTALLAWTGIGLLHGVALVTCAGSVAAVILALAALAGGFTGMYVYTDGVVHAKNGRLRSARWDQVVELLLWRASGSTRLAGRLLAYYVVTRDGRKLGIEARSIAGVDEFGERLKQLVSDHDLPVVEGAPAAGRSRP